MGVDVVLVRHAESVVPYAGGPDDYYRPLSEVGLVQAGGLVAELVGLGPVLIVSSPYLRAVQTVEPLARAVGLPVRVEHDLREWDSGIAVTPDYARHYAGSWADPDFARPGGESLSQLTGRAMAVLRRLVREQVDGTVVVGSHGTFVSRALVGVGVGVDWAFSRRMPMPAVYRLRFADGGVSVLGHVPETRWEPTKTAPNLNPWHPSRSLGTGSTFACGLGLRRSRSRRCGSCGTFPRCRGRSSTWR